MFEIPDPDLPIHCATFMALRLRQMESSTKTVYGPVLKITQLSAHAQNHVSIERWGRFLLIFALDKLNVRHISTSGLVDLLTSKVCHGESFHKVWKLIRPSTAQLLRYCFWYVTWPCDLDLWPSDLGQWWYMADHVVYHGPSTKFEDLTAIRSWVMPSYMSHRIPLTMRLQPLRMRRITKPMRRGQIFPTGLFQIPDPDLPFSIQLLWRYD